MYLKLGPGSSVGIATAYSLDGPRIEFNIPLLNVGRGGLSGRGQGKNWGWYFVWIPDTYHPTGQYAPPSSTGPCNGRRRSYVSLPTWSTTDYSPVGAFLSRILWSFWDELGGRRITDPPHARTLAGTWTYWRPTMVWESEEGLLVGREPAECHESFAYHAPELIVWIVLQFSHSFVLTAGRIMPLMYAKRDK